MNIFYLHIYIKIFGSYLKFSPGLKSWWISFI